METEIEMFSARGCVTDMFDLHSMNDDRGGGAISSNAARTRRAGDAAAARFLYRKWRENQTALC